MSRRLRVEPAFRFAYRNASRMKGLAIAGTVVLGGLVATGWGLLQLSRSTTFQLFGEIVPRVETQEKVVALTFDDGPTPLVAEVLETLRAKNVRATFFLIGAQIAEDPIHARRIVEAGHQVGNHSWSHRRMVFKTLPFLKREIEGTDRVIRQAGYRGEIQFRPPYGKKLVGLPWVLARRGRKTITWDIDPMSDRSADRDADRTVDFVVSRVRPGSIILLHPMYPGRGAARAAVGPIVDRLHARGYRFVTVNELLATGMRTRTN